MRFKVCYGHLEVNLGKWINQWVCWEVAGHSAWHCLTIVDGEFLKSSSSCLALHLHVVFERGALTPAVSDPMKAPMTTLNSVSSR